MKKYFLKLIRLFYSTPYQKTKKEILKVIRSNEKEVFKIWLNERLEKEVFDPLHVYRILFSYYKSVDIKEAIYYGEKAQKIEYSKEIAKILDNRKEYIKRQNYKIDKLPAYYETHSLNETEIWVRKAVKIHPSQKMQFYKTFFTLLKKDHPKIALQYGEKAILLGADEKFKKVVNTRKRWFKNKNISIEMNISDISMKEIRSIIDDLLDDSIDKALEYIKTFEVYDHNLVITLKTYVLRKINKTDFSQTVNIGLTILDEIADPMLIRIIAARAYALREYQTALFIYKKYFAMTKDKKIIDRLIAVIIHNIDNNAAKESDKIAEEIMHTYFFSLPKKLKYHIKNKILFELYFKASFFNEAIKVGEKILKKEKSEIYAFKLAKAYFELGKISDAIKKSGLNKNIEKHQKLIDIYQSYINLKEHGFKIPSKTENLHLESGTVLYVLNNSLPYHSNGYATRAHGLLEGAKKFKEISAITRIGYPHDLAKFRDEPYVAKHTVDGVVYNHLPSEKIWLNHIPLEKYLQAYGEELVSYIKRHNVKLVHSASNFVNGLAANYAANKLNIKSIYEVRGLWEITRISRQPEWEGSEHFDMIRRLEIQAAQTADIVVTITYALKDELVRRGIDAQKIHVLPNGVNTKSFIPLQKNVSLAQQLQINKDDIVIGYIGSIVEYEGIDLLIEAIAALKSKGIRHFKFLLVGDGRYFEMIKHKVTLLNVEEEVIITGRVPHEEVENYYSLIDIAPLPRKALPVSEMVSPLKPFEAMAMGKVVLGSDVAAIAEIIENGYNGMLFKKNNVEDLTEKLEILLTDHHLREKIGKQAREWVEKERDWAILSEKLDQIYNITL